jgi:hypothetical protein
MVSSGKLMHLQTHLLASWAVGSMLSERRDRRLVAWAGVLPDIDALSALWGTDAYLRWHHQLTHGLAAAVVTSLLVAAAARERWRTAGLAMLAYHLHLAMDLAGSGPGWTIPYLSPLLGWQLSVAWAWHLASWQNVLTTAVLLGFSCVMAVVAKRSFAEAFVPASVDRQVCAAVASLWQRLGGAASRSP